jgi:glucose-1-phosphate thymidylyltransferase
LGTKGVILAGGTGSRLWPVTKVTNKHLLPVGRKPMIYHPIERLVELGIEEILVVTGREHMGDVVNLLGSGADFGCQFTYRVQDRAGGIAEALGLARRFVGDERLVVLLGDNIFQRSLRPSFQRFLDQPAGARVLLKEVPDPCRFGVAEVVGDRIVSIVEKPADPRSAYAVTGAYMYDPQVFDIIARVTASERGQLEITDVNNAYADAGLLQFDLVEGWWSDAGTFESLELATRLLEAGP